MSDTPIKKKSPLRVILEGDFNREHQKTNILKPVHHIVLGKYYAYPFRSNNILYDNR